MLWRDLPLARAGPSRRRRRAGGHRPSCKQAQTEAIFTILAGKEQEPTTPFAIYGATIEREIEPVVTDFEFECDLGAARGRFAAKGLFECFIEPIRNPITGKTFRAAIQLH